MAGAAAASCRALVEKTWNVAVATTLQAIHDERSCCYQHRPFHPRQHGQRFKSTVVVTGSRTFAKSSRRVVVRADRAATVTSFEKNTQGSLVTNKPNIQTVPDIFKDKGNEAEEMKHWIDEIRAMFRSMTDGEITISPYDTAWVALVPALDGSEGPQFPKSLEWIIANQLSDGSWGDRWFFSYYDRLFNTLACIIALKTWKTGSDAVEKGVKFIQENYQGMETEVDAHMPAGFELVVPTMMSYAKSLELDLPYNAPILTKISADREKKLAKIPMDILHKVPTTLLHSLEGFHEELDWKQLLKLQSDDGSFLSNPASTAACLIHTKDEKALGYLNRLLNRFNNAVPNAYPVDLFERLWIVDRLQRLGIDRYFETEIRDCLDYVYKQFTSYGIGFTGAAAMQDLDDTAMGFRLLRQHGYVVNEDVFRQFKGKNSEFSCYPGQLCQGVSDIFNFYRATQTRFPGETLLKTGEHFARGYLEERHAKEECFDKWVINKDLPGEVEYALTTPWYCSLPRLETQAYLSQYGPNDIWIGKVFFRMPCIQNETFLALAKADFNLCQAQHQEDLQNVTRWSEDCGFGKLSFVRVEPIEAAFLAVCIFPAPELSPARLVWARNIVLFTVVNDYFDVGGNLPDMRRFISAFKEWNPSLMDGTAEEAQIVFKGVYDTINAMTKDGTLAQGRDIGHHLQKIWVAWLESVWTEAQWKASVFLPSFDEYMNNAVCSIALEPVVLFALFFLGEHISEEYLNDPKYQRLMNLSNHVARLLNDIHSWERERSQNKPNAVSILLRDNPSWTEEEVISDIRAKMEGVMLELVRETHQQSHIPKSIRQLSFNAARTAHFIYQTTDRSAMAKKLKKILFQPA